MPVAVVTETNIRRDLKTLPGAFVVVKRMDYGQKLTKQQMMMKMRVQSSKGSTESGVDIDMQTRVTAHWSFANLIADHNLEDTDGRKLNFKSMADVEKIRGDVGEEIDTYIDELNNFDADADSSAPGTLGNSSGASAPQS